MDSHASYDVSNINFPSCPLCKGAVPWETLLCPGKRSRKRPFKCEVCEITFARKKQLDKHKKSYHVENTDSQHCQICNKDFSVKNGLKYHNTLVHGGIKHVEKTATHHCEICIKDFSKSDTRSHKQQN